MSTEAFSVTQITQGSSVLFRLSGSMGDNTKLEKIESSGILSIQVDVDAVTYINSLGLQRWVTWMRNTCWANSEVKFGLSKVPALLVKNMNYVREFLPKSLSVTSAYLPFYCESCDRDSSSVLVLEAEFKKGRQNLERLSQMKVKCPDCNHLAICDTNVEQYFWFWKIT